MLTNRAEILANLTDPQIDALIELMLLAASADGTLDDSELAQLRKSLLEVDELWLTHIALEERLSNAKRHLTGHSRADRWSLLKTVLPEIDQRTLALELAVQVMLADGILRTTERELILEAAEALDVDGNTAADLVKQVKLSP
jgi:tellurite resistance protein